jgi:type VI secretion system secreted protein Hcp
MAHDIFMKIGDIKGEAKDKTHGGEIDVISWSWGATNAGSSGIGGGGGTSKVNIHDLSFTKYVDKSTPDLMANVCSLKPFGLAQLTLRKAGGDQALEYLVIKMHDVVVTSVTHGGSGGDDRHTENVTLNFAKVFVHYAEQDAKGGTAGKYSMGWDIEANIKA